MTRNVETGKNHNIIREMKRLQNDIMEINEMRWPGTGQVTVNKHSVYYGAEVS